jgi:site-specific DNA-methyltransferase (adenine-specific)
MVGLFVPEQMSLPAPYYQDSAVTIYYGDCLEIVESLPKIDCVITDPPFFMPATHYQSRTKWQRTWADTSILKGYWQRVVSMIAPRLNTTGHWLTFCNHESYPVFYPVFYGYFDFLKLLVWDKGHVGLGRVWRNQHELIIAARWDSSEFVEDGRLRSDVLKYKATPPSERQHPVEKPDNLLQDLLLPTTKPGQLVLDPFAGSGSTLSAAKAIGRRAIGIEQEEHYCRVAANRMSQEVLSLWDEGDRLNRFSEDGDLFGLDP